MFYQGNENIQNTKKLNKLPFEVENCKKGKETGI